MNGKASRSDKSDRRSNIRAEVAFDVNHAPSTDLGGRKESRLILGIGLARNHGSLLLSDARHPRLAFEDDNFPVQRLDCSDADGIGQGCLEDSDLSARVSLVEDLPQGSPLMDAAAPWGRSARNACDQRETRHPSNRHRRSISIESPAVNQQDFMPRFRFDRVFRGERSRDELRSVLKLRELLRGLRSCDFGRMGTLLKSLG